jgi:hypothetical protein
MKMAGRERRHFTIKIINPVINRQLEVRVTAMLHIVRILGISKENG